LSNGWTSGLLRNSWKISDKWSGDEKIYQLNDRAIASVQASEDNGCDWL
jgi:hypothetical protein